MLSVRSMRDSRSAYRKQHRLIMTVQIYWMLQQRVYSHDIKNMITRYPSCWVQECRNFTVQWNFSLSFVNSHWCSKQYKSHFNFCICNISVNTIFKCATVWTIVRISWRILTKFHTAFHDDSCSDLTSKSLNTG